MPFTVQHGSTRSSFERRAGPTESVAHPQMVSIDSTRFGRFTLALLMELVIILDGKEHPSLPKKWQVTRS